MTTETRYTETIALVPSGGFYDASGHVIPYSDKPTSFRLVTELPNTTFGIFINESFMGQVTTNGSGSAIFDIQLPLDDLLLELRQEGTNVKISAYLTTRNYAVWHAAHATVLEGIDDSIESTLKAFRLNEAGAVDIDLAHGVRLITPNEFGADLETYREILQSMRQAFRHFGGRLSGKYAVVSAITQVNPLIFLRSVNAPRWILGTDDLPNGDLQDAVRPIDSSDLATAINLTNPDFTTVDSADSYVNTGTGVLTYNRPFRRFIWTPPNIADYVPVLSTPRYHDNPRIYHGDYVTISSGRAKAFLDARYASGDYQLTDHRFLYLDIDDRGGFEVFTLPTPSAAELAGAINSFMHTSGHYDSQLEVLSHPPSLVDYIEILHVSNDTILSEIAPQITTATATLSNSGAGGRKLRYQSPSDGALGPVSQATFGEVIRVFSDNGLDYIDVFFGHIAAPKVTETFTVGKRYIDPTTTVAAKARILSKNHYLDDGPSSIKVLDGPFSGHREVFGIDAQYATLQQSVVAGTQQIVVPAGTMNAFNSVNGESLLPFKVMFGRGAGPNIGSIPDTYNIIPFSGEASLATISGFTTFQLKPGYTHIFIEEPSHFLWTTQNGVHEIISIDEVANTAAVKFNGTGVSSHAFGGVFPYTAFAEVTILGIDPSVVDYVTVDPGSPLLNYIASFNYLAWQAPNGVTYGPPVAVGGGGYFRLYSDTGDGNKWLDVYVDPATIGAAPDHLNQQFYISKEFLGRLGVDATKMWSMGERGIVSEVTPFGLDEIWSLESPIINNYDVALGSFEVAPAHKIPPHRVVGEDSFGDLNLNIKLPWPSTIVTSANIIMGDPKLPTGWVDRSAVPIEYLSTPEAKYNKGAILIKDSTNDVVFDRSVPFKEDQIGFPFSFKVWARNSAPEGHNLVFKLGFDFGSGVVESPDITISGPNDTMQFPQLMEFTQILPANATKFKVSIRRTTGGSGPEHAIIEKAILIQEPFGSVFLGSGTTPRSGGRSSFGSLFYIWSPDELSSVETSVLGIAAPATTGLIREVHNAHEQIDAFDVTDAVLGSVVNVRGTIDEAEWLLASLTNLEIVSRSPTRFSNVVPVLPSKVDGEEIVFAGVAPHVTTLGFDSDESQDGTILYEDGVPLPNDQWVFNTAIEIEILSGFNASAVYTVDYHRLTRIETQAIDLDTPSNNGNETWFADYVVWNRHISSVSAIRERNSIFFNVAFEATLPRRSDASKLDSILTEDIGTTQRIVPSNTWSYKDFLTVKMDGDQYNPDAVYNLEYNQQLTDPVRSVGVVAEIRSANTAFSLGTSTYYPFDINDSVDGSKRFHQIRLTFTNIVDVRDLRVYSALVKGLNMTGAGSPPPGF